MNSPASPLGDGALTLAELRAHGITPHDIDAKWMDEMVNRLFEELKRELSQLENAKPRAEFDAKDAATRAANARTLDSLQRTLERLNRMDASRRAARPTIDAGEARARVQRRIVEIVTRIRSMESDSGDHG